MPDAIPSLFFFSYLCTAFELSPAVSKLYHCSALGILILPLFTANLPLTLHPSTNGQSLREQAAQLLCSLLL